ncbi:hypothetical protein CkaCkLH20_08248 [Colletotrichum karsti]|uniref:Uncharacterized protein n=1 Tax=Colletotrichum karsti TaxID=1095194 RepID=A0A9P6I1T9_9PEZI|nr:uncharacterized protein CkaCkLH20_08248 [Colletotrichum karsti]KAF9874265.1 hypothetical protein CkaCkLH20_08248 [Colletotrichum karsti]
MSLSPGDNLKCSGPLNMGKAFGFSFIALAFATVISLYMLIVASPKFSKPIPAEEYELFERSSDEFPGDIWERQVDDDCDDDDDDGGGGGGGSGEIHPNPGLWSSESPAVSCLAPCTIYWPPLTLNQPLTVSWPAITTSLWSLTGTVSVLKTTTITIPIFTTSVVSFWGVTVTGGDPVDTFVTPVQSIVPPPTTLVVDNTLVSVTETYVLSGSATSYTILPPPATTGAPQVTTITIQPPPTYSIDISTTPKPVHYTQKPPGDDMYCASNCGENDCRFGCGGTCGPFGCEGCGIFGCGGTSCGLGGCSGGCPILGCPGGLGGGGGGGGGPPPGDPPGECNGNQCECDSQKTVGTSCGVGCPVTVVPWTTIEDPDDCTSSCQTTPTSCGGTETTSTTSSTETITYPGPCTALDYNPWSIQDPAAAVVTEVWSYIESVYAAEETEIITTSGPSITTTPITTTAHQDPPGPITTTAHEDPAPEPEPPKETPTVSYDCKGSGLCGSTVNMLKYCDHAVNYLRRGENFVYTTEKDKLNGNCWSDWAGNGCGVFIAGTPDDKYTDAEYCEITGDDMWWAYQDIRADDGGNCDKCGSKHFGNGCRVTINYVTGCANHES